jgi:hypothetical protein
MSEKPDYLIKFDEAVAKCRRLYKGAEVDIGNWIYTQPRWNNTWGLTKIAQECARRIERGISIKNSDA